MKFNITQDGTVINESMIKKYDLSMYDNDIKDNNKINFVGFSIQGDSILVSFPKNYFINGELPNLGYVDNTMMNVRLLINTMIKYSLQSQRNNKNFHYGNESNHKSNFPFFDFYEIYNYFVQHGIYQVSQYSYSSTAQGKVNWKKTIQNSPYVFTDNGIVYTNPIKKTNIMNHNFISMCMINAINFTINKFNFILDMKPIQSHKIKFDYPKEFIIKELNKNLSITFDSKKRNLIKNLISFYSNNLDGGSYYLKVYKFEHCWEVMVNNFLNKFFIDMKDDFIEFSHNIIIENIKFSKKKFAVDEKHHIELDHFAKKDNKIFIFDSKYYQEINLLDYKQLAYNFLLSHYFSKQHEDVICSSVLFLPGNEENTLNHNIKTEYRNDLPLKTHEYYLDIVKVMQAYLTTN